MHPFCMTLGMKYVSQAIFHDSKVKFQFVVNKREVITRVFSMLTGAFPELSDKNLIMIKLWRLLN